MRLQANKAGRKMKEFKIGQSVRLQDTARKGTKRKLMRLYNGPYQVLDKVDDNEYTIQKIGEGKAVKFRVHVDRMAPYNDLMELDTRSGDARSQQTSTGGMHVRLWFMTYERSPRPIYYPQAYVPPRSCLVN